MSGYRIGAHPYIFVQYGYDFEEQFDEVFDVIADAGFQTIELHTPMLHGENWKARIDQALSRTGLDLVGGSAGHPMWDIQQYDQIISAMDDYSSRLAAFGNVTCGTSCGGKRYADRTDEENSQAVKVWTELGEMFRSKGVTLNYHTHGEPIEDIRLVIDNVPADLVGMGPDLDWLRVGGVDPVEFIRENAERLIMLHVRDYHLGGDRTEALGEGDADYRELGEILHEVGFTGEFVVELAIPSGKKPTRPLPELLKISRDHLRKTIGW
ncbi:sugar phosphate isomerase/epimerase family protein [Candidatus Poribacteria bacterium]